MDIFKNYNLQRDELLARIAEELELDNTRREKLESAYNYLRQVLERDDEYFKGIDLELYSQGSVRIGTTVKPLSDGDFDLDTVVQLRESYQGYLPHKIYNELIRVLENEGRYDGMIEVKNRCVRINYKSDFHIDILPSCDASNDDSNQIAIPEVKLESWSFSCPKGFGDWFTDKSKMVNKSLLENYFESHVLGNDLTKADIETEPLPNEKRYKKSPLQRAVQLVKRYRDIYFENDKKYKVSSIVITTLMGEFYNGEESIYDAIDEIIKRIKIECKKGIYRDSNLKVYNPTNKREEFTEFWTQKHYQKFREFINDLSDKWDGIRVGFDIGQEKYKELFGLGLYQKSLKDQVKELSKYSDDEQSKISALILNESVYTDRNGKMNENKGVKNDQHRNYGGTTA